LSGAEFLDGFALEGELRLLGIGSVLELCCGVDSSRWARYIHTSDNPLIQMLIDYLDNYSLEMFQLIYEPLQLEGHKIEGKIFGPVEFRKVSYYETHPKFTLADMVKAATRITTILPKQCIKSTVEGFMCSITLASIHN
jgi:hypothetical protein